MFARIDTRPRHRNSHRADEWKRCEPFLKWLRGRSCMLADRGGCSGKVRACHVDHAGGKGMGTKVADMHAIPMCDGHHTSQHAWGWMTFEANFKIDGVLAAAAYWQAWPGRRAWETARA